MTASPGSGGFPAHVDCTENGAPELEWPGVRYLHAAAAKGCWNKVEVGSA